MIFFPFKKKLMRNICFRVFKICTFNKNFIWSKIEKLYKRREHYGVVAGKNAYKPWPDPIRPDYIKSSYQYQQIKNLQVSPYSLPNPSLPTEQRNPNFLFSQSSLSTASLFLLDFSSNMAAPLDMSLDDIIKNNKKSRSGNSRGGRGRPSGPGPVRRFPNRGANRTPYAAPKVWLRVLGRCISSFPFRIFFNFCFDLWILR